MKYLFPALLLVLFSSCKKSSNQNCRLSSIQHFVGLGNDTIRFQYKNNGQIDHAWNSYRTTYYIYQNNQVVRRESFEGGQLAQTDSVTYDAGGNIIKFIVHRFDEAGTAFERDEANFIYQGNKLSSAQSQYFDNTALRTMNASFSWTGDDISSIVLHGSSGDFDSTILSFSAIVNPFHDYGVQALLLDPGFDFIRYSNFRRIAFVYSQHTSVAGTRYLQGNISMPLYISIETDGDQLLKYSVAPLDEEAKYFYDCNED